MYYKIGIGFVLPFAVFVLIVLILNEKKKTKQVVYDEMQTAVRGRAYHYATVTGVLAGIITSFLLDWDAFPMDGRLAIMAVSFLMVTVYVVYMVMKGVYFGVSGNWKKWTLLFFIIGVYCQSVILKIVIKIPCFWKGNSLFLSGHDFFILRYCLAHQCMLHPITFPVEHD